MAKYNDNFLDDYLDNINERVKQGQPIIQNRIAHELINKKKKNFIRWKEKREHNKQKELKVKKIYSYKRLDEIIEKYGNEVLEELLEYGYTRIKITPQEKTYLYNIIKRNYKRKIKQIRKQLKSKLKRVEIIYGKYIRWVFEQYYKDPMVSISDIRVLADLDIINDIFNSIIYYLFDDIPIPKLNKCTSLSNNNMLVAEAIGELSKYGLVKKIDKNTFSCNGVIIYVCSANKPIYFEDKIPDVCMTKYNKEWKLSVVEDRYKEFEFKIENSMGLEDIFKN